MAGLGTPALSSSSSGGLTDAQLRATPVPVSLTSTTVTGSVAVTNAGLTELAAAINASSQMDVNIAASGATVPVSNAGLTALNGAISGTEVQVDVLTLPAITGTVTANAGTNLNTSALALETGGNLASIKAKTDNIPALGQALAASSVPVVLTAAQIATLTPLSTVAVTQSGTWDEVGVNDSGNSLTVDAPVGTPVFVRLSDGAAAISTLPVSLASVPSHAVTNAGTFAVQDATAQASLSVMDDWDNTASDGASVSGDVAHDAADAGEPVKIGGQARTTNPTAVADADRVNAIFDKIGRQVVTETIRDLKGVQQTTITSSTSETTVVTAVASTFLDVYGVIVTNTSATVTKVTFKDATAGTTRFVIEVPATETRGFMLPASAAVPQAASNNNWTATCGTSVASVEISVFYVKNI